MLHEIELDAPNAVEHPKTISKRQVLLQWLKQQKILIWGIGLIFPTFLLYVWHMAVEKSWVNPLLLPAPELVGVALKDLYQSGELWSNLSVSLSRIGYGFSAGILIALALGLTMGLSRTAEAYIWPTFKVINLVPVVGWIPLLVLLVGIDEALKIILIAKAALVPMTINVFKGVRNIPQQLTEVAEVYQLGTWSKFKNVVLPGAFMSFIGGLRLSLASSWGALVAVELLASSEGIGYVMVYGRQIFQLDVVMATVVVIGLVGFAFDFAIRILQRQFSGWDQAR
ncbi:ABC transporter permease [Acinetobacter sp. YH12140]|uniref:ABC transporter permease n=1 Tax=Acinetobacter sp. YH12140 TaxID=2601124 RepID=UPI0015D3AD01|nr:ABC transporter permease [Acinetobacter sp. YH12140]